MYNFGKRSKEKLYTCHKDLIKIMEEAIKFHDFSIIEGIRTTKRQQELYSDGKSQLDGIHKLSKHQDHGDGVSHAVDIMPYYKGFNPFTSENGPKSFYYLAGLVQGIAKKLYEDGEISHILRWGGNWDSDMDFFNDSHFFDLPHFELIKQ
jgi:peptidoglycan L-alanyl-D-glutamate endopeptidase CwlK